MKKILIVDDNANVRLLMAITFAKEFETVEALDGESALAMMNRSPPDAVLLDIMMPGAMDGLQLLEAIKASPKLKDIPVAMITARGQASDYRAGLSRGADAYFIKPFSPLQVVSWVRKVVK
jgi:CheY-like chemotaxis protein